jgi:hypothetical protein
LSFERAGTSDLVQVLGPDGAEPDSGPPLGFRPGSRYPGQRVARANALWGVRAVAFLRVAGFESLTGVQDVRRGFQASTMLGRSIALLGTRDDDYFVSASLYSGMGGGRSFLANELRGEARHDNSNNDWRGGVIGGRGVWYLVPDARWRFVTSAHVLRRVAPPGASADPAGRTRGGRARLRRGARGRQRARRAARRVALRARRAGNVGDLGVAAFADAGKAVGGGAPYGVTRRYAGPWA